MSSPYGLDSPTQDSEIEVSIAQAQVSLPNSYAGAFMSLTFNMALGNLNSTSLSPNMAVYGAAHFAATVAAAIDAPTESAVFGQLSDDAGKAAVEESIDNPTINGLTGLQVTLGKMADLTAALGRAVSNRASQYAGYLADLGELGINTDLPIEPAVGTPGTVGGVPAGKFGWTDTFQLTQNPRVEQTPDPTPTQDLEVDGV